jgi:hypothetical protein
LYILRNYYYHQFLVTTKQFNCFLSSTYSTQNTRVIMIVCIYDVYSSQKDLSKVGKCISHKKADLTMLIMMYIHSNELKLSVSSCVYRKMACKNICEKYRAKKDRRSSYYIQGYKRCQICGIFINWNGTKCPCCQRPLRSKPHNKKGSGNQRERMN